MASRGKIKMLPTEVLEELDRRLVEQHFSGYRELKRWLRTKGCEISHSALQGYGSKLELKLEAVARATAQARAIVEAAPDDECKVTEAMLRLVQHELFGILVDLTPADAKKVDVVKLAGSVAQMGRTALMHRKWAEQWRSRLQAKAVTAEGKLAAAVTQAGGGVTDQTLATIRSALLEMTE
jgi:hypothetical protein